MRIAIYLIVGASALTPVSAQETAGTGAVSRSDFVIQMDLEFNKLDRDGNRVVPAQEIVAAQRESARQEALRQNRQAFATLDKDKNGTLDLQEFAALANPNAIPVDPSGLMKQFDTNRDGQITLLEYRIKTQENFDRIDTDRDGVATVAEMRAGGIVPKGQ